MAGTTRLEATDEALRSFTIDRDSPIPLYFQVARHLQEAISSGAIPPGTLFENEIVLAENMGVSRPTMRRAMEHLVDQGLIVRRRGIGTRVVQPRVRRPLELTSFYDDLASGGQRPTSTVLEFAQVPAPPEVAEHLRLAAGDPVVRIVRVRSAADVPLAKMTNYLPADLVEFTREELEDGGLYDLMRRSGIHLFSASQTVGARNATSEEAALLGEPAGAAVLTMQRETLDESGRTVEWATHLYAASRYSFETHLAKP